MRQIWESYPRQWPLPFSAFIVFMTHLIHSFKVSFLLLLFCATHVYPNQTESTQKGIVLVITPSMY
jgi:hypothetical protein